MGNTGITKEFSRLKSVSSIDHNYLETVSGGVLYLSLYNYKEKQ